MAAYTFTSEMWLWQSNGGTAWTFITLPQDVSDEIEDTVPMKGGFGSVKVDVTIGATEWSTSLFPSLQRDTYILPVNRPVRVMENLDLGNQVNLTVSPVFGHDCQSASRHT
jgi:hypothetical protein